uniref:PDZ domain-containing protein n=1 Tax=Panagrolaimus sp. ES5 TaxID=591445 RepID=A0AC34F9K4_9BILA
MSLELLPGYSYLLAFLATFPGAKVGLYVKSYENRVYISSISHGSLSEAVFHVGDVILSVDDVAIATVSDAHKRIHDALKTKRWVQTVIERAESKVALQRMNVALKADRKLDIDPKMAEDIGGIVAKEIKRMKESKDMITVSQISRETPIQCDPVNVKLLIKVPTNRPSMMQRKRLGKARGFGAGPGFFRHLKTPSGISYTEFVPSESTTSSSSTTTCSSYNNSENENEKK